MSEMIERVAQAICDVAPHCRSNGNAKACGCGYGVMNEKKARRTICAMREPTDTMITAAYDSMDYDDGLGPGADDWNRDVAKRMLIAAIDEALK